MRVLHISPLYAQPVDGLPTQAATTGFYWVSCTRSELEAQLPAIQTMLTRLGGSALADPAVTEALVEGQVALAVLQWSGAGQQELSLSWQRMQVPADVARFANRAAAMPRAFQGSDTAVGQAITAALAQFAAVPDCSRQVIDISGDGQENTGFTDARARAAAVAQGTIINAIAIEEPGPAFPITTYYRNRILTPGGFVVTARGLGDYAGTLRLKLLRELAKPIG